MIGFRAILICDNARVEQNGALTLANVYSDRLLAPAGEGPIFVERFMVVAILRGLRGSDRIGIWHQIRAIDQKILRPISNYHAHDPKLEEHNFVFAHEHVAFGEAGEYVLDVAAQVRDLDATESFKFTVTRR